MIESLAQLETRAAALAATVPSGIEAGAVPAALYGLGMIGRWTVPQLLSHGVKLAACYDGNPALAGASHHGVPVRAPSELANDRPDFVFVTARHAVRDVSRMLAERGIRHVSYDGWEVAAHFERFRAVHDALADDRSREVLRAVMQAMLTGDVAPCEAVFEKDQYFSLPKFCATGPDVYIDAGAFVGDSVESFIWAHHGVLRKIYAFEPGPRQFAALKMRAQRLVAEWALAPDQIELVPAALGSTAGKARSDGTMTSLAIDSASGGDIDVVTLDGVLGDTRATFIKADVEGMERALLAGAANIIRRDRPKLAICAYHYPPDIPDLMDAIRALVPEYRFALRHHSPQLMETVLYAWVD